MPRLLYEMEPLTMVPHPASLLGLPTELQDYVIQYLDFPDVIFLKMTCRRFNSLIRPLNHGELLKAEHSIYSTDRRIYACRDCLRLRPASKFADNMLAAIRIKGRFLYFTAARRFCVECGVNPRNGATARYSPGSHIVVQGVHYVICQTCKCFKRGVTVAPGINISKCRNCWQVEMRELEQRQKQQERARQQLEHAARMNRRRRRSGHYQASGE